MPKVPSSGCNPWQHNNEFSDFFFLNYPNFSLESSKHDEIWTFWPKLNETWACNELRQGRDSSGAMASHDCAAQARLSFAAATARGATCGWPTPSDTLARSATTSGATRTPWWCASSWASRRERPLFVRSDQSWALQHFFGGFWTSSKDDVILK